MTALRSALYQVLFLTWTLLLALLYLPLLLGPRQAVVGAARLWLKGALVLLRLVCGLGYRIEGRENLPDGPFLIAAKHQSAWDTMIFHQLVADPAYILKKELLRLPFVGWYLWKHGMIAIDRAAGMKALKQMVEESKAAAAEGRTVIIFPEGTRTAPGERQPYHTGVAMLYGSLGVPVVPVALNSGLYYRRNSFLRRAGTVTLEVLPAILPGKDKKAFMAELQQAIEDASDRLAGVLPSPVEKSVDVPAGVGPETRG